MQDPILIFLEKKDSGLVTQITKAAQSNKLPVKLFNDEEELLNNTNEIAKMSNGVFIVDKAFGRGIDFKFKKEASVLILLNDDIQISWEDAVQMAGRGNRSQGNPSALLMLAKATKKQADILTILRTNSAVYSIDGCDVLTQVFTHFHSLSEAKKTKVAEYLQKNSWTMPLPKKPEDTEVFKWLSGMKN